MKEIAFIGILLILILLGLYSICQIDCFLQEHYRMQWEAVEEKKAPLKLPRRHAAGLWSLLSCGTIFLRKHTLTDEVRPPRRGMH